MLLAFRDERAVHLVVQDEDGAPAVGLPASVLFYYCPKNVAELLLGS